jgi:predicted NBD/HSP70 family sugar kinase
MTDQTAPVTEMPTHGGKSLPTVEVDSYNLETKDDDGFLGDRVNKGSFRDIIDRLRKALGDSGDDPFGDVASEDISKSELDTVLRKGEAEGAAIVQGAIEDYAKDFAAVIRRYLNLKSWRDTQRIVIGGGFRAGRVGELAIGRASLLLKEADIDVPLVPIRNDPDEAGLIGAVHLVPSWMLKGHQAILAVDIGGTNIRAGVVELNLKRAADLSKACVWKSELWKHAKSELWKHADEKKKMTREQAVETLAKMLQKLIARAEKEGVDLTPFIGIGCPGIIEEDGTIDRGAQNLPGNWESSKFHLPASLGELIPKIGEHRTVVLMHNDAVVQGLSEAPFMRDVKHWGVLTIGTGLGNARFTNRPDDE